MFNMNAHLLLLCVLCWLLTQRCGVYAKQESTSVSYSSSSSNSSWGSNSSYVEDPYYAYDNMAEHQILDPDIKILLIDSDAAIDDLILVTLVNTSFEPADYAFIIRNTHRSDCSGNVIRIYDDGCSFALLNLEWYIRFYIRSSSSSMREITLNNIRVGKADNDTIEQTYMAYRSDNCSDWSMNGRGCEAIDVYDDYTICYSHLGNDFAIPHSSPYYIPHLEIVDCTFRCANNCSCTLENVGLTMSDCYSDGDGAAASSTTTTAIVWNEPRSGDRLNILGDIESIGKNAFSTNTFIGNVAYLGIRSNNLLRHIEKDAFDGFSNLTELDLGYNLLAEIENGTFNSLVNLRTLKLEFNQLEILPSDVFLDLINLSTLFLRHNSIASLPRDLFLCLPNLVHLWLQYNRLARLKPGTFHGMYRLEMLDLQHNRITALDPYVFDGLYSLRELDLRANGLRSLAESAFLRRVSFTDNDDTRRRTVCSGAEDSPPHIDTCPGGAEGMILTRTTPSDEYSVVCPLQDVKLSENNITDFSLRSFTGLENASVDVDQDWLCCFMKHSDCVVRERERTTNNFLTCNRLLPNSLSMILLWIFGFLAVLGNLNVIFCHIRSKGYKKVQSLLIANLAVSDLLMGAYMLIIASADAYYGDYFPAKTESWRNGSTCLAAGTMAMLSSEASILFVSLISVDRLMGIRFTFSGWRMRIKSASVVILVMWIAALTLSLIPVLANVSALNYELSEVCVALPLSRKEIYTVLSAASVGNGIDFTYGTTYSEMYYSIAVFIGLNSICCLIIAVCYIWIFITVKTTAKHAGRQRETQEEVRIAMKMSLIVLTDFCTWVPVIIMGILVQAGVQEINPVANVWIVTLLMPINSAINPFMYTLSTVIVDRFKKTKAHWSTTRRSDDMAISGTQEISLH